MLTGNFSSELGTVHHKGLGLEKAELNSCDACARCLKSKISICISFCKLHSDPWKCHALTEQQMSSNLLRATVHLECGHQFKILIHKSIPYVSILCIAISCYVPMHA